MPSAHYRGAPGPTWLAITRALVQEHPLFSDPSTLLSRVTEAWDAVWGTQVGVAPLAIPFAELDPRAAIVGDFFETLLSYRLAQSGEWRRGTSAEKDLIYLGKAEGDLDTEIKTSGQAGGYIYGNRSYAQPDKEGKLESAARKKRAGYYLCVNFHGSAIFRVRVGWIDAEDWEPQKAPTGQMAGLKKHVYEYKLLEVPGDHYLGAPLRVVDGVGSKRLGTLADAGFQSVGDVALRLQAAALDPKRWASLPQAERARVLDVTPEVGDILRVVVGTDYFDAAWPFTVRRKSQQRSLR
ncbi:ScaI family restriction endonuclease [Anaeromyxobacter soli]|uniref:ScaI family restriction endonuclease n=1 Tax=Anaeromyxobacter soli TaxID=2922725 RepID=UPI001FAE8C4E|nr:ScaI family restriction endonuclease [Anaeromyxobacter sp. SG29]